MSRVVENLFELLKSDEVSLRIESGNILNQIVSEDLSEEKDLIPRMIVPAILSLAADSETQVRKSAIPCDHHTFDTSYVREII